jgi:hypothetical protein
MKRIPPLEQLVRETTLTSGVEVQQRFVRRKDDEERERHDPKQEERADQVTVQRHVNTPARPPTTARDACMTAARL